MTIARRTPGISIRRAPSPSWYHFTFNGAPGSILADPALRLADRQGHRPADHRQRHPARARRQSGAAEQPHLRRRPEGLSGQQRSRWPSTPREAKKELDALGWRMNGQFREKDGTPAGDSRRVLRRRQTTRQVGQIAQNSLAQIGVKLDLDSQGRRRLLQPLHHGRQLRHRPVLLGRRRLPAVAAHPDLPSTGGEQLRQDRQPRDRREDRADPGRSSIPTRRGHWPTSSTR